MENFATRVLIKIKDGDTIAYLHTREAFDLLNIPVNDFNQHQYLEIGNEFIYDDIKYKIVGINFVMMPFLYEAQTEPKGVNLYSPDAEEQDFDVNSQVGIFVERV